MIFDLNSKLGYSAIGAAILVLTLLILAFRIKREPNDVLINIVVIALSISFGWLFGVLISPYNEGEKSRFAEYASAVSSFISGYLIAKVDSAISKIFSPDMLLTPVVGFRVAAFISGLIVIALITSAFRSYA